MQAQKRSQKFAVANTRQLRVLSSPVRQVILDALVAVGEPASIKMIANRINRSPESLYYHFREMSKAKLILDAGGYLELGKPVNLYLPAAQEIKIKYDLKSSKFRKLMCSVFAASTRLALRDFEKGIELQQARCDSDDQNLYLGRGEAWLTKDEIKRINKHVAEIRKIMTGGEKRENRERCSVFFAMSPIEEFE